MMAPLVKLYWPERKFHVRLCTLHFNILLVGSSHLFDYGKNIELSIIFLFSLSHSITWYVICFKLFKLLWIMRFSYYKISLLIRKHVGKHIVSNTHNNVDRYLYAQKQNCCVVLEIMNVNLLVCTENFRKFSILNVIIAHKNILENYNIIVSE